MKIFLLKQNITDQATLDAGIALAISKCASIGFPLEFRFADTSKTFTSVPFNNETNSNGYEVNPTEIFQEAKNLGYQPALDSICALAYNWNTIKPQPTNPADNGQVIQLPENWYNGNADVMCEFTLHELCHYLFSATGLPDVTHAYPPAFGQKSRTDYYLYLITTLEDPFNALISPATPLKPDVVITRLPSANTQTTGYLNARKPNGVNFSCYTLELPWLNNQPNISCIPTGIYNVKWVHTFKFPFGVYQLQNVINRSGIDIHSGNFSKSDIKGCILFGSGYADLDKDGVQDIINSRITINNFQNYMQKLPFTLQIK